MKDDDKHFYSSTPRGKNAFYNQWLKSLMDSTPIKPKWIGIDWAKDSGMNRGDVIKKDGNVTHVRFNTVEINH